MKALRAQVGELTISLAEMSRRCEEEAARGQVEAGLASQARGEVEKGREWAEEQVRLRKEAEGEMQRCAARCEALETNASVGAHSLWKVGARQPVHFTSAHHPLLNSPQLPCPLTFLPDGLLLLMLTLAFPSIPRFLLSSRCSPLLSPP